MIAIAFPDLNGRERQYVDECVTSTWISSNGRFLKDFEAAFAPVAGTRHVVLTNNGTTALHLALAAIGVGPGDEVIVPTMTYIATANAVRYCGATPVLADCDPRTYNIDPEDVERRITGRTKAIIPVHLYGNPSDMVALTAVAQRHGVTVLEDAAEAHGATVDGRPVGSLSRLAAFSFFGNKIITTGEGGAVTTDDDDLAARLRLLRGQGMDPERRYWFPEVGFNYRMTNVAAAIGLAQVERLPEILARRSEIGALYADLLGEIPGILQPQVLPGHARVEWLQTVRVQGFTTEQRNTLIERMGHDGIETRPVFYPLHVMPPYADGSSFPAAELVGAEGISLPTHTLLSDEDVHTVCRSLERHTAELRG